MEQNCSRSWKNLNSQWADVGSDCVPSVVRAGTASTQVPPPRAIGLSWHGTPGSAWWRPHTLSRSSGLVCVFRLGWVLVAGHGPSPAVARGAASPRGVQASHGDGFSCRGARAQQLCCMGLVAPRRVGSLRTRDGAYVPSTGRWTPIHWTARKSHPYENTDCASHCASREVLEKCRGSSQFLPSRRLTRGINKYYCTEWGRHPAPQRAQRSTRLRPLWVKAGCTEKGAPELQPRQGRNSTERKRNEIPAWRGVELLSLSPGLALGSSQITQIIPLKFTKIIISKTFAVIGRNKNATMNDQWHGVNY